MTVSRRMLIASLFAPSPWLDARAEIPVAFGMCRMGLVPFPEKFVKVEVSPQGGYFEDLLQEELGRALGERLAGAGVPFEERFALGVRFEDSAAGARTAGFEVSAVRPDGEIAACRVIGAPAGLENELRKSLDAAISAAAAISARHIVRSLYR